MCVANKASKMALAATAAMAFATIPLTGLADDADHDSTMGHCAGVNACKGMSSCQTADNSCKGQNACKGQGFVEMSKQTCDQVGGQFEEEKAEM